MTPRDRIHRSRVIAIVRTPELTPDVAVGIVETLGDEGLDVVEFTMNSRDALGAIAVAADRFDGVAAIGAGTVLDAHDVRRVAEAGASFVVAPDVAPDVVAAAGATGLLAVPGAYTASEVRLAQRSGADLVKLFPAMPAGPAYLSALRGPLPDVGFVPTGGVGVADIVPLLRAGAVAVGLGSVLVAPQEPLDGLARRAQAVRDAVASAT